jgi:hypothetical protein
MENPPLSLLEPWCEFVPGQADAFLREIQVELSPGHPLYGVNVIPCLRLHRKGITVSMSVTAYYRFYSEPIGQIIVRAIERER